MPTFETSNTVAILAAGRNPQWEEQLAVGEPDYAGAPSSASAGVPLGDVVQALFFVQLRREAHHRTAYVTLTYDAATTYTITVNATAITPTPGANLAALVADLINDINGAGAINALVSASSSEAGIVKITGLVEADFALDIAVSGGAGTIAATIDPTAATARLYATGKGPNAPGRLAGAEADSGDPGAWAAIPGAVVAVTYRNLLDRATVSGCDRLYVELSGITGHVDDGGDVVYTPHVFIGPCAVEA